jgi:hypothetical protein
MRTKCTSDQSLDPRPEGNRKRKRGVQAKSEGVCRLDVTVSP